MARMAFQMKNLYLADFVMLRSFQVILECKMYARMVVTVVAISVDSQIRSLLLIMRLARIA